MSNTSMHKHTQMQEHQCETQSLYPVIVHVRIEMHGGNTIFQGKRVCGRDNFIALSTRQLQVSFKSSAHLVMLGATKGAAGLVPDSKTIKDSLNPAISASRRAILSSYVSGLAMHSSSIFLRHLATVQSSTSTFSLSEVRSSWTCPGQLTPWSCTCHPGSCWSSQSRSPLTPGHRCSVRSPLQRSYQSTPWRRRQDPPECRTSSLFHPTP